jgi:transcriptional regulator with XRE-family HTH domain
MAKRPHLEAQFTTWLGQLGTQIRDLRAARGWTQVQAAEHCALDYKRFQAIEYGQARVTAHTLFVIADGFGVDVAALMPSATAATATRLDGRQRRAPWAPLRAAGWRVHEVTSDIAPAGTVPIFDLAAAAGPAGPDSSTPPVAAWATPPRNHRKAREGLFLARAVGHSMEPLVPDGAWCLFRQPPTPPLLGKVVLLRTDLTGQGEAATFQIKRIGALELAEGGDGVRVRLDSLNPGVPPIELRATGEAELQAIGEFVEVVAAPER